MMDYSKLISPSIQSLAPSGIRKFFDIAAEMKDAISLGVGEQGQLLSSCPVGAVTPAHSQLHLTPGSSLWAPEFQSVLTVCLTHLS